MSYSTENLTHISTLNHDDGFHKDVVFECEKFVYSARCFEDIIQFIKGKADQELTDGTWPTEEQLVQHEDRKEAYNGDHQPLQTWIDNL
jgi:hypothetical protein